MWMSNILQWQDVIFNLSHLGIALVLAFPIAFNREITSQGAGLRTFPLVAVASCAYMLVGRDVFDTDGAEAKVMYGIITGMGFIGGGAILKNSQEVIGTATAASLWNTGAIGVAVGYGRYEIAIILSILNFVLLHWVSAVKKRIHKN